jgi:hypothetical protein
VNILVSHNKKDKILFYLNSNFVNFGIAKFLQEKYDYEIYAIIDCNSNLKKFFQNQKIVQFKKSWYFRDYVQNYSKINDLVSLKEFENKYNINLWKMIYGDRFFDFHNEYYNFSYDEILSVLSNETKLFESIINEINPDFAVIKGTDLQQNDLLQKLCIAKKIPVLTLYSLRFGNRTIISQNFDELDEHELENTNNLKTLEELHDSLQSYSEEITKKLSKKGLPTSGLPTFIKRLKIVFKYISLIRNNSDSFAYKGRTLGKVIKKNILFFLQTNRRKSFLKNNSILEVDFNSSYVYFPLHLEPERILSIGAPYYQNQLEVIKHVARSIPIDFKLYVKDHPAIANYGYRSVDYYKQITDLPNVELISLSVSNEKIIKNSKLVITIAGTSGLEAAFFGRPVITLSDVVYSVLPNVIRLRNIEQLSDVILTALTKKASLSDLNNFVNLMVQNSFDFDIVGLFEASFIELWYEEILDVELTDEKMNQHLTKHKSKYEKLVYEHIKKIQFFKKNLN